MARAAVRAVPKTAVSFKVTPQEKQRLLAAATHFQGVDPSSVNLSDFLHSAVMGTLEAYERLQADGDLLAGQRLLHELMTQKEVEEKEREVKEKERELAALRAARVEESGVEGLPVTSLEWGQA